MPVTELEAVARLRETIEFHDHSKSTRSVDTARVPLVALRIVVEAMERRPAAKSAPRRKF